MFLLDFRLIMDYYDSISLCSWPKSILARLEGLVEAEQCSNLGFGQQRSPNRRAQESFCKCFPRPSTWFLLR